MHLILTYCYRIKDSSASVQRFLDQCARSANFVWNFCNDAQRFAIQHGKRWPTGFDLSNLCKGTGKMLGLHSQTVQAICEKYAKNRKTFKKRCLRYRGKKSTGWVPFKASGIKVSGDSICYQGQTFHFWLSSQLRSFVEYKAIARDRTYKLVNEANTTRTCSYCGALTGPKGRSGLGIREWTCSDCGTVHDRDVNSANNILRLGHQSLLGEIQQESPSFREGRMSTYIGFFFLKCFFVPPFARISTHIARTCFDVVG